MKKFYPIEWVCDRYEISKSTAYKWVECGWLPARRIGGGRALRFVEEDLEEAERKWKREGGTGYGPPMAEASVHIDQEGREEQN